MKRYLLAVGVLLSIAAAPSWAFFYVIFKVNVTGLSGGKKEPPAFVSVIVPVNGPPRPFQNQPTIYHDKYVPKGRTMVFVDLHKHIEAANPMPALLPSLINEYNAKIKVTPNTPAGRLELADWTLAHGMLKPCADYMDKLIELERSKPSNDSTVQAAVAALGQLRTELRSKEGTEERALATDESAIAMWKEKLGISQPYLTNHYVVLSDVNSPEVPAFAHRLEDQFHGFYYWFALKGKALPLPRKRLVVVLLSKPEVFREWHTAFESPPLLVDGFYSRRDNLAVFSGTRLDDAYTDFANYTLQELWQKKWNKTELLKGQGQLAGASLPEWARAQTFALIQRALRDEAWLEAISQEGTRQLVAASGLLSRSVAAPEWIVFGLGSFFEISKGSLWTGYGGSSWDYLVQYKEAEQNKQIEADPVKALTRVITDQDFNHALHAKGMDAAKRGQARTQARLMAWALTYFIAQRKTDGLFRFYDELSKLPRDLELDDTVYLNCFARAFGLADPANSQGIDSGKMKKFADEWYQFMYAATPPIPLQAAMDLRRIMKSVPGAGAR